MNILVQSRALRGTVATIALLVSFSAAAAISHGPRAQYPVYRTDASDVFVSEPRHHTAGPRDTILLLRAEEGVRFAALRIQPEDLQAGSARSECAEYRLVGPRNTVRTCSR
ncbi:hypothetical protein HNQ60_003043 [Povalibacter uvarum]|uniref:Uncharacterized protein n=1 Tax=Povalibacter uvarum TaxID=732238 RepID=A0A841HQ44_9GAMM|nr:hypothetical protein [Povalibacter uvarum]MBB6094162.1 hypothetical protein [Povalibacter uvarum]